MTAQQVEGLPEAKAQEVLDAWVKAKNPELPQALSGSASKAHAKLAKKALYRLQSSGGAVPEAPKPAAPVKIATEPKNAATACRIASRPIAGGKFANVNRPSPVKKPAKASASFALIAANNAAVHALKSSTGSPRT